MKIEHNILIFIIAFHTLTPIALCQKYAAILGSDDRFGPEMVMRIEVRDSETHLPIDNARITLKENSSGINTFTLQTDEYGIGIVIVLAWGMFPSSGMLTVIAPDYHFWETKVEQWDYYSKKNDFPLLIEGMKYDWTFSNRPSISETISALKHGRYTIFRGNYTFYGPPCFEYAIDLVRVQRRDN